MNTTFQQHQAAAAAEARATRVADVEADLALGIEPGRIAAGFGISPDSLARSLYRAGRKDLAARFRQRTWTDKNTRKAAA